MGFPVITFPPGCGRFARTPVPTPDRILASRLRTPAVGREVPLNANRVTIGLATVVMLVVLRLSLGCHFLYEGVWKIKNADEFSAKPFLTQAKGPLAPVFYAMVPDLDGRERLRIETMEVEEDGEKVGRKVVPCYVEAWRDLLDRSVAYYNMPDDQQAEARKILGQYVKGLDAYLTENEKEIAGYFKSLDEFEKELVGGNNGADFQQARLWDRRQALRAEAGRWIGEIERMGDSFHWTLWGKLDEDQRAKGVLDMAAVGRDRLPVPLPMVNGWSDLLDKAVTYGLTVIGLCLMLGLCTRLAALGGAAFLVSVLATQPPWPTIYPPFPEVVGHSLVVDKNFIEMVALLLLATTAAGRWGGLDWFLHRWLVRPFFSRKAPDSE